jgi:hypothetical protein
MNSGRFRFAFLSLFWKSVLLSLIPFALLLAPDNTAALGILFGVSAVLFCVFVAISAYDVWVASRAADLDSARSLRKRSLIVFYASNTVAIIPFVLLNGSSIVFILTIVLLTRMLVPWVVAAISKKLPFDSDVTRV